MKIFIKIHPVRDTTDVKHFKNLKTLCDNEEFSHFSYIYLQRRPIKTGFVYKNNWIEKVYLDEEE